MYRNGVVTHHTVIDEDTSKIITITASFYDIWSFEPNIRTYHAITFDCDVKNVPKDCFNLFDGFHHFDHLEKKENGSRANIRTCQNIS